MRAPHSPFLIPSMVALGTIVAPLSVVPARAQPAAAEAAPEEPSLSQQPRTMEQAEEEPQGDLPPPPPRGASRTISGALSLGPGWLALRDDIGRDGQRATGFAARAGVVVGPEWNLVLGIDRTSTSRGEATFSQTAGLVGVQRFFLGRVYLGAAVGLAWVRESGVPDGLTDGPGVAIAGTVGVELLRRTHWALTAEVSVTLGRYEVESWEMGGVRLGVVVF